MTQTTLDALRAAQEAYAQTARLARETQTFIGAIEARVYSIMDNQAMAATAGGE